MKVLIAEDDPSSRRMLERVVQGFGHQVACTANGQEAWDRFVAGDFDFVLTDWNMPGLDGLEFCRRIRSAVRPNYVYVIMITSHDAPEDLIEGMNAGADDFIAKPLHRRALQVRMRAAERILKLQQELSEKNLELETINARLRRLSRLDALMQIGNRLAFEEAISDLHSRAARYGNPYGVIMCDVDHFKSYNDQSGHPAGDQVLRLVAGAVKSSLRTSDSAYRYGGDEMVALLPEQSLESAAAAAERLRAAVESLRLFRSDLPTVSCFTVTCGVAACPAGKGRTVPEWETVLDWADQALYSAKAHGRNRVEQAECCLTVPAG